VVATTAAHWSAFGGGHLSERVDDRRRFDAAINEWHCRLNGCLLLDPHHPPLFTAHVYVQLPRRDVNVSVYNLKIELACTALRTFFEPCTEVRVFIIIIIIIKFFSKKLSNATSHNGERMEYRLVN